MTATPIIDQLFNALPELHEQHVPTSATYALLKTIARREIQEKFAADQTAPVSFGPFGQIVFPYFKMGAVDSLNLFDLDELIIFTFYWIHRNRYHRVLDIGANIGLHSLLLSRSGYEVRSFEPDPVHFEVLLRNLKLNAAQKNTPLNVAVSDRKGSLEFIRVKGNTTGSHLAGSKSNPYGELDRFPVSVDAIQDHLSWADLIKLDAEGHEKQIITAVPASAWKQVDALIEISSSDNAHAIFTHFQGSGVNLFAQKNGWRKVQSAGDLPISHHEGTLFLTSKPTMDWTRS